jgi:hypothetical protein
MSGTSLKAWPTLLVAFCAAFIAADLGSGKGLLKGLSQASILGGPGITQSETNSSGW